MGGLKVARLTDTVARRPLIGTARHRTLTLILSFLTSSFRISSSDFPTLSAMISSLGLAAPKGLYEGKRVCQGSMSVK
jgi:hypothetical protein